MSALISQILIFVTVLFSFIMPGNIDGAVVTVDNDVKTTKPVIEYTITNKTGYVMANDSWIESLEIKVGDKWYAVPEIDDATAAQFYVNPDATMTDSYNAGFFLAPGTYRLTVGYNVVTDFDGTCTIGYSSTEFNVAYR